jgi:hypothetical protein
VSTHVGRLGPVNVGPLSYRRRYLAIYDDALVYVRLNPWEDADLGAGLNAGGDNLLIEVGILILGLPAALLGRRRTKAVLRDIAPEELAGRHPENWMVRANEVQEAVVLRRYDVGNSRRLRIVTPDETHELRYRYGDSPDEVVRKELGQILGARLRMEDERE